MKKSRLVPPRSLSLVVVAVRRESSVPEAEEPTSLQWKSESDFDFRFKALTRELELDDWKMTSMLATDIKFNWIQQNFSFVKLVT